jgi:hypothetical protein
MRAHVEIQPGRRVAALVSICTCGGAYAWWATGIRPFSRPADVAVAIPAALLLLAAWRAPAPRPGPRRLSGALPWIALALVAVGLEAAGLALGGRSRAVPTLSTVADQALTWHVTRWLVFALWLGVGAWPSRHALRRRERPGTAAGRVT